MREEKQWELEMETSRIRQKDDAWLMSCARTPSEINPPSIELSRNASSFSLEMSICSRILACNKKTRRE